MSYNRDVAWAPDNMRGAWAENVREVHVVCTNRDWDEAHPKGSRLDDVAVLRIKSYAKYICSGYLGEGYEVIEKPISKFTADDFAVVTSSWKIAFDDDYDSNTVYEIERTLVTTDGKSRVVKGVYKPTD